MGEPKPQMSEADEERQLWLAVSGVAMEAIWGNEEDDVYEQLLTAEARKAIEDSKIDG